MNAIRRDEDTDNIHSMFVDQWDWEKIITPEQRTLDYLKEVVECIYQTLRHTENYIVNEYSFIGKLLPEKITYITSQELEDRWPEKTAKEYPHAGRVAAFAAQIALCNAVTAECHCLVAVVGDKEFPLNL